jgi:hypothetical protein
MSAGGPSPSSAGHSGVDALRAEFADCAAATVFDAALRASQELGFAIISDNPADGTLVVRSSIPVTTAAGPVGPELLITVSPADGGAQVVIAPVGAGGYGLELARNHQLKSTALMFLDRVSAVLPSLAEHSRASTEHRSTACDLAVLTELLQRGLLTQDEFAAEKQRLLS